MKERLQVPKGKSTGHRVNQHQTAHLLSEPAISACDNCSQIHIRCVHRSSHTNVTENRH
ncbi:50S ribosomal protein L32 [uncultured Bacteroides sp.]|uniref:50S ribosomal protein L32 n=1 Tax=uncultured Bacteroides sp. TaxID=162156 RepID=UPI0037490ECD